MPEENPQTSPNPPMTPAPTAKSSNLYHTVLILLILILIGITGYLAYQNNQLNQKLQQLSTTETSPTQNQMEETGMQATVTQSPAQTSPTIMDNQIPTNDEMQARLTKQSLPVIPTVSTSNWQQISYQGISFQIPDQASFANGTVSLGPGKTATVQVLNRNTQTVRDQFISNSSYQDCNWLEQPAVFGKVSALQMAADGGQCQGSAGGVLVELSNKLVIIRNLYYDPQTKTIYRDSDLDTIVSTVKI